MTNRTKTLLLLPVLLTAHLCAFAQKGKDKKKEEEKVPVYNYVIDDPMDAFGKQPVPPDVVNNILLPEFFMMGSYQSQRGDTMIKHIAYNAKNEVIWEDTVSDYQQLRFVSYIKTYPDPVQKYKDANGNLQPLPIQKIIYRYDKIGNDKWLYVDYAANKQMTLQEHANDIVRTDTASGYISKAGNWVTTLHKYYRVMAVK